MIDNWIFHFQTTTTLKPSEFRGIHFEFNYIRFVDIFIGPVLCGEKLMLKKWLLENLFKIMYKWCLWKAWNYYDLISRKAFADGKNVTPNIIWIMNSNNAERTDEFEKCRSRTTKCFDRNSNSRTHLSVETNFLSIFNDGNVSIAWKIEQNSIICALHITPSLKCKANLSKYSRLFALIAGKWFACIVLQSERWTVNIVLSTTIKWKIIKKLLFPLFIWNVCNILHHLCYRRYGAT